MVAQTLDGEEGIEPKPKGRPRNEDRDPRPKGESANKVDGSGINSHVHRGIDETVVPAQYPGFQSYWSWWDNGTKHTIMVNEERLFTMSHLTRAEKVAAAKLMTKAQIRGNRVLYMYTARSLLGTLGTEGRGRQSLKEMVIASAQKINESVQLHKTKRVLTGRGGKVEEQESEEGYDMGGE